MASRAEYSRRARLENAIARTVHAEACSHEEKLRQGTVQACGATPWEGDLGDSNDPGRPFLAKHLEAAHDEIGTTKKDAGRALNTYHQIVESTPAFRQKVWVVLTESSFWLVKHTQQKNAILHKLIQV